VTLRCIAQSCGGETHCWGARQEESGKQLHQMIQDGKAIMERAELLLQQQDAGHGAAGPAVKEDVPAS